MMIKKIRRQIIFVAMLAMILVIAVLIVVISAVNFQEVVKEADNVVRVIAVYGGAFPEGPEGRGEEKELPPEAAGPKPEEEASSGMPEWSEDEMAGITGETPFESRYFSVRFTESGETDSVNTEHISLVNDETAVLYAKEVFDGTKEKGFRDRYRYCRWTEEDGRVLVVFLDCERTLENVRSYFTTSILIALLGIVAVFILVVLFSYWAVRPIQESYNKQRRFITDAGHELKTPLAIIDADISVLELDTGENEWTEDMKLQTKRLADLTGDLIYLSRMEEGEARLTKIEFPLSEMVSELAQSFRSRAEIGGFDYQTEISPDLTYVGDENAIRKLVSILLDNAFKYTCVGGKILLSLEKKGKGFRLSVENDTAEMDEESVKSMFDRFYRADKARNSEKSGYGIGLSVAKAVTEAHGGKIGAEMKEKNRIVITAVL